MNVKPGTKLLSAVCSTELIVVKATTHDLDITIGGQPAVASADERNGSGSVADGHGGGTGMGKRYVNDDETVELLCTKAGDGIPAVDGELLQLREAKPLPASD